jgi:small subunit ribosomal protein S15
MARMHSRKKGKSRRGKKMFPRDVPSDFSMSNTEVESLVEKYAKEGMHPAKIGLVLKKEHKVPDIKAITGKTVSTIMKETNHELEFPADLMDLIKTSVGMRKHLETNNSDVHNKSNLRKIESKIRRLVKYYNQTGRLNNWRYDAKTAALMVR